MFNTNSRLKNIFFGSTAGVLEQIINYGGGFIYRTVFLAVLSSTYLGISGLFTNILQIFSLAELGIGAVIAYRLYAPIKYQDEYKCAQLLGFYKKIYRYIALTVLFLGMVFYFFIGNLIKDPGEIPKDVNISYVYWLFVLESVSSYFYVYYQSLLSGDQKGYVISIWNSASLVISYVLRIVLLYKTRNFTLVLSAGIVFGVVYNLVFGQYIKRKYSSITSMKVEKLSNVEVRQIFKDTGGLMCHKIGYTVVNATDSILLSKYIGIAVVGLYSNYSLVVNAVDVFLNRIFGSFVPTIGNYLIDSDEKSSFEAYNRLRFLNFWVASFCAICIYILIDPFIIVWLGENYLLDRATVTIISLNVFFNSSRIINASFINASGLFVKDRIRPLFQSVFNIVFSIYFIGKMGISGVFLGTLVSTLLTVWWREGIILYRTLFKTNVLKYYVVNVEWFILTALTTYGVNFLAQKLPYSFLGFICKCALCFIAINGLYAVLFCKNQNFAYYKTMLINKLSHR